MFNELKKLIESDQVEITVPKQKTQGMDNYNRQVYKGQYYLYFL